MVTAEELQSMLTLHGGHLTRVEVPPGWMDLVAECHRKLVRIYPEYKLSQVKEKFGTLRFYMTALTDEMRAAIQTAEEASAETCELCGASGVLQSQGWFKTLCDRHHEESEAKKLARH